MRLAPFLIKLVFDLFHLNLTLELAKGKHSVEVDSASELIKALEVMKAAVEAGELDNRLIQLVRA